MELFIEQFKKKVHDQSNVIDPDSSEYWKSLTLGWAIGKGMSIQEAKDFATFIRYHTNLG